MNQYTAIVNLISLLGCVYSLDSAYHMREEWLFWVLVVLTIGNALCVGGGVARWYYSEANNSEEINETI